MKTGPYSEAFVAPPLLDPPDLPPPPLQPPPSDYDYYDRAGQEEGYGIEGERSPSARPAYGFEGEPLPRAARKPAYGTSAANSRAASRPTSAASSRRESGAEYGLGAEVAKAVRPGVAGRGDSGGYGLGAEVEKAGLQVRLGGGVMWGHGAYVRACMTAIMAVCKTLEP